MLCTKCASIDLASYFEHEIHVERKNRSIEASPGALQLGTSSKIYTRYSQCDLCDIVFDTISHRSCRNEWLLTEWLLNESNIIGAQEQCVIYSYAFGRCVGTSEDGSRKVMDGNHLAIEATTKEKWPGSMVKLKSLRWSENLANKDDRKGGRETVICEGQLFASDCNA